MNKELRANKTKKLLKEALISLLEVKSLDNITVKEICEKANINRVTFYDHYFDKEELHNEIIFDIENDIVKEFKKDNSLHHLDKNYKKMLKRNTNQRNKLTINKFYKKIIIPSRAFLRFSLPRPAN